MNCQEIKGKDKEAKGMGAQMFQVQDKIWIRYTYDEATLSSSMRQRKKTSWGCARAVNR